ncbi:four-helix bundle copper-binding protein [Halobacillus sp. K22]|uniref:four-helix bundle copper-binding protein n=1 Tax=Halobacillus sp. K22 TaxID=3457431 RepID=UPI003FCDF829
MPVTGSSQLLKKADLLKNCCQAYAYAAEVHQNNSRMAEDMCKSCAEVCRACAEECLKLEQDSLSEDTYQMCLKYAEMCEKILDFQPLSNKREWRESV